MAARRIVWTTPAKLQLKAIFEYLNILILEIKANYIP